MVLCLNQRSPLRGFIFYLGTLWRKAFNQKFQAKGNHGQGRRSHEKGQNHAQRRNHTNFGEDHFGGNGEENVHGWNYTKKV